MSHTVLWYITHSSTPLGSISPALPQEGVFDWSPDDDELDNDVDLESSLRGDDLPQ